MTGMTFIEMTGIIISILGTILIVIELFLMKNQTKYSLEKAIREKTVDIMMAWSNSIKKESRFAEKIVENFNLDQCKKLYEQIPFKVSIKVKKELCQICPHNNNEYCISTCKKDTSTEFEIAELQLSELRWYIIQYLNSLETVMVSWQQGVVDCKIIESQFTYLYDECKGRNALKNFRNVAGNGHSYPIIEEFCNKLKENATPPPIKKLPVGAKSN